MASALEKRLRPLLHTLALAGGATDGQLLEWFLARRHDAAFRVLVDRHGPMVMGVCRRVLQNTHDAEDAFQATFLVLARKAASVVPRELVANWLYGVAYRTAQKARVTRARADALKRRVSERIMAMGERTVTDDEIWHDLQPVLDEELQRLPEAYRSAVVLCDLEGKSRKDAAQQLGWPEGTLSGRLARARKLLAERLTRRGVALSAAALATVLSREAASAAVPTALKSTVTQAAWLWAGGHTLPAGVVSAEVTALTEGVMKTMLLARLRVGVLVFVAALAAAGTGLVARRVAAETPQAPPADNKVQVADAEMHVLGVYGSKAGFAERGRVDVEIRPTAKPVILVMTSYYAVDWHLKLVAGARVQKIIVSGYDRQTVQGLPASVPVVDRSGGSDDGAAARTKDGYFWAYQWNTPQWRETMRRLNDLTGLPAATFQGDYQGVSFVVDGTRGRDRGQTALTPPAPKEPMPQELLAASAGAELHVVGTYTSGHDNSGKPIEVEVRPTGKPIVLVLTAYMDAVWNVKLAAGARVNAVVAGGYFPQAVDGLPAGVPVHHFCPDPRTCYFDAKGGRRDRGYFYAYKANTSEYRRAVRALNDATGLLVSTFQGEYAGTSFVVDGTRGREFVQSERKPPSVPPKEPTPQELLAAAADAELHLVSVYGTGPGGTGLPIDVDVRPTDKPVVLALVSYGEALWNVKIADGARLRTVIIGGYFEQECEGIPNTVPLVYRTYYPGLKRDFFYGHKRDTPEYRSMVDRLNAMTGRLVATSQVAETGKSFVVDGTRGRDHAQKVREAGGAKAPDAAKQPPKQDADPLADVADIPTQDLRAGDDADKRYFLIGPKKDAKPPVDGYGVVVILPGGDGSADFNPFVRRIVKNALPDGYVAAQPVALKWTAAQQIVWPTKANPVETMKFGTEEFVAAVVEDVAKKHKLDRTRVFTLSWSSSGPAAYATALQGNSGVTGSLVAMSVFNPRFLPPLTGAKGHAFYLYHSQQDRVCPYRMAEQARDDLKEHGATVHLETYAGGHGWRGDMYGDIRAGVEWLEKNRR